MGRRGTGQTLASAGEVFGLIRAGRAATRAEIGRDTGLSRTAVVLRVDQLLQRGLVVERADGPSTGGRPPARLRFNAAGGVVLVAALGYTHGQLAACDLAGRVLAETSLDLDISEGPDAVLPGVVSGLDGLLGRAGYATSDVRGIGVSMPGTSDVETGHRISPPGMPAWERAAIPPYLTDHFAVPVHLDNDVNAMALGEHRAQQQEPVDDLLFVKVSTGIGAAIVSGGQVLGGAAGAAGEIGHTPVCAGDGRTCRCGSTDCLETVAGGWALAAALRRAGRDAASVRDVTRLVLDGDPEALRLVRAAGRYLGEVLAGAVNLLNPGSIVLGGDLAEAYEPLAAGISEIVYQRAITRATRDLRISPSALHERSGIVGLAALVLDDVLSPQAVDAALAGADAAPA